MDGRDLYEDPARFPFDVTQYPPLYYVLAACTALSLRIGADDAEAITRVCRGLSLVLNLVLLSLIYRLLRRALRVLDAFFSSAFNNSSFACASCFPIPRIATNDASSSFLGRDLPNSQL